MKCYLKMSYGFFGFAKQPTRFFSELSEFLADESLRGRISTRSAAEISRKRETIIFQKHVEH
jgi:hypothetical protein